MNSESRNCQNCHNDFLIEPDDFAFYEKMKVPPPTFCPECRFLRRLCWRNNRSLFKRSCGLCNKSLVSFYKDDGVPVYCESCYSSDAWDMYQHGVDFDFSLPFLQQLEIVLNKQPRVFSVRYGTNINSDYSNSIVNSKNLYLTFSSIESEDIFYSENTDRSKNCLDCLSVRELQYCYWNVNSEKNHNCHFMHETRACLDSYFLFDCVNCSNCFMSSNLRNQSYVFYNKKLSKEEYEKELSRIPLDSFENVELYKKEFNSLLKNSIHKYAQITASVNVSGDIINNSKNIKDSFDISESENVVDSYRSVKSKELMDCGWVLNGELEYESMTGSGGSYNQVSCFMCIASKDIQYSISCKNCSDCFGCVGLKNAKYCILNKQYSKEDYFNLLDKIKNQMTQMPYIDQQGRVYRYGEFFPLEMSLFGYNESLAYDFFPITKESALVSGYNWFDRPERDNLSSKNWNELNDSTKEITDSIIKEIFLCHSSGSAQCTKFFSIQANEFLFYKQKNLPLPRFCPNCRHYERLKYRNPMRLYKRECTNGCGRSFETSYAPDRPEKVYCEQCYQAEVL